MADKSRRRGDSFLSRHLKKLLLFIPNLIWAGYNISSLISIEARMAAKSALIITVLAGLGLCLLVSIWFCLLGLMLLYFISFHLSLTLSLFCVLLINLGLFIIICLCIVKRKRDLFFPATCRQLMKIKKDL